LERQQTDWTGVAFGVAVGCLAAYQQFKLPPVLPLLLQRYGYDRTVAGGLMSVYALAGLLLSLPLGRALDRRGMLSFLQVAFAVMIIGNLLMLAWPASAALVLVARLLEGAAFAVCAIVAPSLATRSASPRHLAPVIGLVAAWIPIGQLVAIGLASAMLAAGSWRALWWAGILLTLAMAGWALCIGRSGRFDAVAAGPGGKAATGRAERRRLAFAALIFLLWSAQYFAFMTWLPQYLVEVQHLSAIGAVAGYAVPVATLLCCNLATGMALRAGLPIAPLLVAALAAQAAVWWAIPLIGAGHGGLAALFVYGVGAGVTPTCLYAVPAALLGRSRAGGGAFAVLMIGRNVGVLLGPVVLAEAVKLAGGWASALPIFAVATTLAAACGLLLARWLPGAVGLYGTSR
jgi:MFS family permease